MYVYVCAEENNFLNCCSNIYFVSGDRWIYVRLFLVLYHYEDSSDIRAQT